MQPLTDAGRQSNDRTVRSQRCDYLLGETAGGCSFGRGALYHLLRNRIYRGEVVHGGWLIPASKRLSSTKERKAEAPQVMLAYHSQPSDRPLRSMALRYRMRIRCRRCDGRLAQFDLACLPAERNTLCQLRYGAQPQGPISRGVLVEATKGRFLSAGCQA